MILERLRNLWKISAYNFDQATKNYMTFTDGSGNTVELKKTVPTIKKKLATIIPERSQLHEGIQDEGGTIE